MQKNLFLEFDGVLHPALAAEPEKLCRMPRLEEALQGTACRIVIASKWRFFQTIEELLCLFPPSIQHMIIGTTGKASTERYPRYAEIQDYLSRRSKSSWRALDATYRGYPSNCAELIFCQPTSGLSDPQVHALREWLNG